jgi:hypothetical protein
MWPGQVQYDLVIQVTRTCTEGPNVIHVARKGTEDLVIHVARTGAVGASDTSGQDRYCRI